MTKIVALVAMLALVIPVAAQGSASGWRKVAQANDASSFYASATITTTVKGAVAVKVAYAASGRAQIDGHVSCFGNGFRFESRDFSFYAKRGYRSLPLPIRRGDCSYFINSTLMNGGAVAVALWAYR